MMKRAALSLLAVALLAGCSSISSLNPFGSKPDPRKQPAPLAALPAGAVVPKSLWTASVGASGMFVFTPAVVNDSVYVAGADGSIVRLDGGRQIWRVSAGQALSGGVGADGKYVAVGTPKGEVLVFSADDGKALWSAKVASEVLAAPLVSEGFVAVRGGDARLYVFPGADGKQPKVYQRSVPALSLRAAADMAAVPGAVLAGFSGGKLVAISLNNAAAVWEVTVALPKGATELERVADVTSAPVISGRDVCAVAYQGRVACFDAGTAQARWAREASSSAGLDMSSRAVFVSDDKGNVLAYDRQAGASLWKQDKLLNRKLSRPLVVGSLILVGDFEGQVHLLRQDDGSIVGRFATDGTAIVAAPQNIPGGALVQTSGGHVYALKID